MFLATKVALSVLGRNCPELLLCRVHAIKQTPFLTHSHSRVPLEILSPHTFENNLGMKRNLIKYLKEICCLSSDQHFLIQMLSKKSFCKGNISKIVRSLLVALSVYGLTH